MPNNKSSFRTLVFSVVCAAVSGCGDSRAPDINLADCFPREASPWIAIAQAAMQSRLAPAPTTTVYMDGSQSMRGYLRGAGPEERPLADLVATAPWAGSGSSPAKYILFGANFTEVEGVPAQILADPGTFSATDSRIDEVLNRIASDRGKGLSVLVTDFWLHNPGNAASSSAALGEPLRQILADGRGVAVYGIRAPYNGRVFDLPDGRKGVTARARPLYVIVVGRSSELESFDAAIRNSASTFLRTGLKDGRVQRALFAVDSGRPPVSAAEPLRGGLAQAGLAEEALLPVRTGLHLAQYIYRPADRFGSAPKPFWTEPVPPPGLVRAPQEAHEVTLWELTRSERCVASDWQQYGKINDGWSVDPQNRRARFTFDPQTALSGLPTGTYLVVGRVLRAPFESQPSGSEWMHDDDWSLGGDAASVTAALARADGLMPTLGLDQTASALENAVNEEVKAQPNRAATAGFAFAVRVTD